MLKGETIIYFGPEPWQGLWRNRHQLMSRFARHNDVWYVEPPTMLRQLLAGQQQWPEQRWPRTRLYRRDPSGVKIFNSPWWLPVTGRAPLKEPSLRVYFAALRLVARLRRRRPPIVWLSRPYMIDYLGRLSASHTIYHVVDEYRGYSTNPDASPNSGSGREETMLHAVDSAIVVTSTLYESKSPFNADTHIVPNAADFDAYATGTAEMPGDMADIPSPIVGYSGLVAYRLDIEMLTRAAKERPDWSFVFVGAVVTDNCEAEMIALGELPNVHLLGRKTADDTARYVQHFDVCMIPYRLNLRAQNASPLKLFEYAAASKPIVSSDFNAARDFGGHIAIYNKDNEFVTAVEKALTPDAAEIAENLAFAAENTWDHRVEQISAIVTASRDGG